MLVGSPAPEAVCKHVLTTLQANKVSPQPNERADKVDKAQVGAIQLVEAGKDAAKLLELVETAFDQMPFAIVPTIVVALDGDASWRSLSRIDVPIAKITCVYTALSVWAPFHLTNDDDDVRTYS
jgi:hypothetical protein